MTRAVTADDGATAERGDGAPTRLPLGDARGAAAAAREFVGQVLDLAGWDPAVVDDAKTVVSELVVGALARGRNPHELTVTLDDDVGQVRLEVSAEGRLPPQVYEGREEGMALVHGIAAEHGSRPAGDGRVLWAVLLRKPPTQTSRS